MSFDPPASTQLHLCKGQVALDILIKGFGGPPVEISGKNPVSLPIEAITNVEQRRFGQVELGIVGRHQAQFSPLEKLSRQIFGKEPVQISGR